METTQPLWTIEALTQVAAQVLRQDYWGPPSRQVAELPNLRTVRYYTTLGLLDRPIMRGRIAYYTRRHLAQLVAIKRLQAEGLSLVEIQQRLYGLTDEALERIARLPESLDAPAEAPTVSVRRRRRFWKTLPAPPEATQALAVQTWQVVSLAPGVELSLQLDQPLDPQAIAQIQRAAMPLMRLLNELGVVSGENLPMEVERNGEAD
ncbi:MAG: helix-turn-helix domain-containing protein [Armatimonadetes bacterium]|nr:helix-turn-helix domain-containing protein [Armatimonadota bacterium]CUU37620.1 DNA-binding transcriptional regulator, MerR family [Armatimonadetes bacterium DC]